MVAPLVRALSGRADLSLQTVALTTGGAYFTRQQLPFKGFKDYLRASDEEALVWGERLASTMHTDASGIAREESVAYLGLSYQDLVTRHGAEKAAQLWAEKKRHAFLPISVMERIFDEEQPDIVVTTNSPRSEHAAVLVANARGIPSLSMIDLFGFKDFHVLEAQYLCVLNEIAKANVIKEGTATTVPDHIFVTGNPAFDLAFDYRGPKDTAWRDTHFPAVARYSKAVLWADMPGYFLPGRKSELYLRSQAEIEFDLGVILQASIDNRCALMIRPHPSQDIDFFRAWCARSPEHVFFAGDVPLYPLINSIDALVVYNSTVAIETLLTGRRVVQLKYKPGASDVPLAEWGLAWLADQPDAVSGQLHSALYDDAEWDKTAERIAAMIPQQKAAPRVAEQILKILQLAH